MNITFKNIYCKLSHYNPILKINQEDNINIIGVMLLTEYTSLSQSNVVYVGLVSNILHINIPKHIHLVLINDCSENLSTERFKDINIIEIPQREDLFKVYSQIQEYLLEEIKIINSTSTILKSLIKNKGLNHIIETASSILNNPVILIDTSFKILSHSVKSNISDIYWDENIKQGYCSYDFVTIVKKTKIIENVIKYSKSMIVDCYRSNIRKIVSPVYINENVVAYLIILELDKSFSQEDIELSDIISYVLSEELAKNEFYTSKSGIMYETFLLDLLAERISNHEIALDRMHSCQCDFGENFYVLSIYNQDPSSKYFNNFTKDFVSSILPFSKSIFYEDHLMLLIDLKNKDNLDEITFNNLKKFLKENHMIGGLSTKFSDLLLLKKHYIQSVKAIKFSPLLKQAHDEEKFIYYYDECKFYDLISSNDKKDLLCLINPELIKLMNYDKTHDTSYFKDLYFYISNNLNLIKTSKQMFIHRNTLSYRLEKIKEITGINLEDGETVFQLQMCYRILKFIGSIDSFLSS